MNTLQNRLEVYMVLNDTVNSLINDSGVSPTMVEDALYKVLAEVKNKAEAEFLISAMNNTQSQEEETKEQE